MKRLGTAVLVFFCAASVTITVGRAQPAATVALATAQAPAAPPTLAPAVYDLIIRNGRVLDGDGNPWFRADIGVRGDRIAAVGNLGEATAARTIDASGLYVAPGFIDTHTHTGPGLATPTLAAAEPQLAEGITTVFVNPDGEGQLDLAAQRTALLKAGTAVNVAQQVPHGPVREAVLGREDRHPTAAELDGMRSLVRAGMQEGAWGLSSGPFYYPQSFADTQEFVEMAKVVAAFGGAYQSHIRDESDYHVGVIAGLEEVITVAGEAKLPSIYAGTAHARIRCRVHRHLPWRQHRRGEGRRGRLVGCTALVPRFPITTTYSERGIPPRCACRRPNTGFGMVTPEP